MHRIAVVVMLGVLGACNITAPQPPASAPSGSLPSQRSQSASPTARPATQPPFVTSLPSPDIETFALGTLSGQWAFVTARARAIVGATPADEVTELWGVPLEGGEPKLAARFLTTARGGNSQTNVLRRQFSPDGRQLLLAVTRSRPAGGSRSSLIVVDLASGGIRMIGSDAADSDTDPAWSPDGRRIAYRRVPDRPVTGFDDGIWVMNADGTSPQRIVPSQQGTATIVYEWTPDSVLVAYSYVFEDATFTVVDVSTGVRTRFGDYVTSLTAHSWRERTPALAGAFKPCPRQCEEHILVTSPKSAERKLVTESDPNVLLDDVRWHPTRDEVLYRRTSSTGSELFAVDLGGATTKIATATAPLLAEWWPTGNDLVYVRREQGLPLFGSELRTVRRDGTNELVLFARAGGLLTDLAVRRY